MKNGQWVGKRVGKRGLGWEFRTPWSRWDECEDVVIAFDIGIDSVRGILALALTAARDREPRRPRV